MPILKDSFSIIDKENILVELDTSKGKEIWNWTMFIAVAPGARANRRSDIEDRSEIIKKCKEEMARSL
ncbi:MAG TPA: hypothetical protein VK135_04420 [Candidatus Dormibacteraeota bacterium]|nr:hypothetical protein [Candidatus Dormibacteraeota bacterium]